MFGKFIKELRSKQRLSLRAFCAAHGHDPSNWSKIEREVLPPPRDDETLRAWAKQLGLKHGNKDWIQFFEHAAVDSGRIPQYVLNQANDSALAIAMPEFFRTISGQTPDAGEIGGNSYSTWCRSKDLRVWADTLQAQQKLPALVRRLVHGTIENPGLSQFPADEGTCRHGWDGVLTVDRGNAWVPKGRSVWEMGVDQNPATKANNDYSKRSRAAGEEAKSSTFVFVTLRKWEGKTEWVRTKRREKLWADVRAWDCDDLEQWLETAPAVDAWLARLLSKLPEGVRDLSSYWMSLAATSKPALPAAAFLAGRKEAEQSLRQAIAGAPTEIVINALSLAELRDFVSAVLAGGHGDCEDPATARALIVETVDAWNQLCTSKNRLLLIPGDQLPLERHMVAEAVKGGHHVLTQAPYAVVRSGTGIRLPRADRWELQKALETAGFADERASRLAREAGGCLSILVRLASHFAGQATPAWSKPQEAIPLLPLVLLGAWSDQNEEDRKLVERCTGQPYAATQQLITRWITQPDAPLRLAEGTYSFVSREDSWQLLSPAFTNDLLNRFTQTAKEVLGEEDPRFDMPAGERYLAAIHRKLPKFSPQLRDGIAETVALLGTRGEKTPQGATGGSSWRASQLVSELLDQASPKRWFSLEQVLPLLAEAAPDEFLSAVESDLRRPSPGIMALFEKDADGFFSSSPHTSLMWALELLAWDTAHLARVILILATLIRLDSGGRINPRPAGVMFDIFRFWFPQTSATIDERLQVLDLLSEREPDVAWTLLLGLIPEGHDTATGTVKPRWRDCDSSNTKQVTDRDIARQAEWTARRLIEIANAHREKWPLLLKDFAKLPQTAQKATLKWLREVDVETLSAAARTETWEQVRDLINRHRFYHDAWWAMPQATVDELVKIERKLLPRDPIIRSKWLFDDGTIDAFGNMETPHEERERMHVDAQTHAVREVFETYGLKGIFTLGSGTQFHFSTRIGDCLARSGLLTDWQKILPEKLVSKNEHERGIALGYAAGRKAVDGTHWVENIPLEDWSPEAAGEFALILGFEASTWQMLRKRKPDAEAFYWRRVHPWVGPLSEKEVEEVVGALLQSGRPMTAIDALAMAIHNHKKPNWKTVADAVDLASSTPQSSPGCNLNSYSIYELVEVVKYLQADSSIDPKRLAMLEWRLLPLARYNRFEPRVLHRELSENPRFFVEILSSVYRAKDKPRPEHLDESQKNLAEAAHSLLESWLGIPGAKPDGAIDENTLNNWVAEARKSCAAIGRLEICDEKIGEQLSYSPPDSDGSWPCKAVRDVFEGVATEDILRGFDVGVFNQRGVTSRGLSDGGDQERQLAAKYRGYAERCKVRWPRTAVALRRIAEHYESQAKWHDARADSRL